jgi:hypothetical protein
MTSKKTTNNKATPASLKLLLRATPTEIRRVRAALSLLSRREREKARYAARLSKRCAKLSARCRMHAMTASHALTVVKRLIKAGTFTTTLLLAIACAHADDRDGRRQRREQHNYIIERQQAYQVQGVPTQRLIIGRREIDIYRNGVMFERNNVVGFRGR